MVERSKWFVGISLNGIKLESSEGMVPELLMMIMCSNDGTIGEGDERFSDGERCWSNGKYERLFNLGVVINTFTATS
jgi:hypothetical protein